MHAEPRGDIHNMINICIFPSVIYLSFLPMIRYLFVMVLIYGFLDFFSLAIWYEGVLPVGLAIMSNCRFASSNVG